MAADRSPSEKAKKRGIRRLGDVARPLLTPALRKQGFAQHEIVTRWRDIVGPLLGGRSVPERLHFPRGSRKGGTLTVRVDSAFALEFQHLTPQVLDRVNTYYGYGAVEKLAIRQGPIPRPPGSKPRKQAKLTSEMKTDLEETLAEMKPGPTRDSLNRLGQRLLGNAPKPRS